MRHALRVPTALAERITVLHPGIKRKLRAALDLLMTAPHSGKPLRDGLAGLWSLRIGKFRLIYRISQHRIDLVAFGPRDRIYEETQRLLRRAR